MNATDVIKKKSNQMGNKISNPKPECISLKPNLYDFNLLN